MRTNQFLAPLLGYLSLAEAATTPIMSYTKVRIAKRQHHQPIKMPQWNYANATTPDATPDGKSGVILEPDLIDGKSGKDGSMVKKVRIGPYKLKPGQTVKGVVPQFNVPCNNCYITAIQLICEYPDGKEANVNTGAWCHHMDLVLLGSPDYTCPTSLGGLLTLSDPAMGGQRIFSGGNERTVLRMNGKSKFGLDLGNFHLFGGAWELMSESKKDMSLYMVLKFEFVPKTTAGYKPAKMVWLDVTDCGRESEFPASIGTYKKESKEFVMKDNGEWLVAAGHVHDGGTKVEMFVNGQLSCSSKQIYANRRGGYVEPTDGSITEGMAMPEGSHISDVGICKNWATFKKGDKVKVIAYYNDTEHMQMKNPKGVLEGQMGIMFTYVGITS